MKLVRYVAAPLLAFSALLVSLAVPDTAVAAPGETECVRTVVPALVFNPCAVVDKTQVIFVKNGVKYSYCWTSKRLEWCMPGLRFISVPVWRTYRVGPKGHQYKYAPAGCHVHL
jgi:hypothetical protein